MAADTTAEQPKQWKIVVFHASVQVVISESCCAYT